LPTYPFERQRYWIDPPSIAAVGQLEKPPHALPTEIKLPETDQPDLTDWFYLPSWKRSNLPQSLESPLQNHELLCWLLFVDTWGIGEELRQQLELAGQTVICVRIGEKFDNQQKSIVQHDYTINPSHPNDYATLLATLQAQGISPQKIVHLWSLTATADRDITLLEQSQTLGLNSLLFLAQAIGHQNLTKAIDLTVICNHIQTVTGDEKLCPEKSLLLGAVKVIPLEYDNVTCRSMDIILPSADSSSATQLIALLLQDLITPTADATIAYRGSHRWVQTFEPIRLDKTFQGKRRLKPNGVYLITGGLGKVGLTIARYLAEVVSAKLILVGRSDFPQPQEWHQWLLSHVQEDAISQKIQALQAIEALGSKVWVARADVAQREQMQSVVIQAESRFERIDGIVHAAGILGDGAIQRKTLADLNQTLHSKVQGTLVLASLFPQNQLDFVILFSSVSAIAPVFGQIAYSAANNFLDTFAQRYAGEHRTFISAINWDVFGADISHDSAMPSACQTVQARIVKRQGILPEEGAEVFSRILGSTLPQVLVSTSNALNLAPLSRPTLIHSVLEPVPQTNRSLSKYARPQLRTEYASPTDEIEHTLANIWQELLGIELIGIHDDFFELGGDSLFATRLMARIRETISIKLPLDSLFETPTIAGLAQAIRQTQMVNL
jgi:NAD(P)-dependent dehydrogenase (short-subunit alcohol dehydrogenase family)/acyl carrier protein